MHNVMKCTRCKEPAGIKLDSHNAKFCPDCFEIFFQRAVITAMKNFGLGTDVPLMVAISGGKDSLACWDVLNRLGYETLGIHIDLGIPEFSEASIAAGQRFADEYGLPFKVVSMEEKFGWPLPVLDRRIRKNTCSVCGTIKRSLINQLTVETGYKHIATGHHLDDESARLMGNLIRNHTQYLEKYQPHLPSAHPMQAARLKPLYRCDQIEILYYNEIRGIKPVEGMGCPFNKGATSHYYQKAMTWLEKKMPGTKRDMVFSYLKNHPPQKEEAQGSCKRCGQPSFVEHCGACRLADQLEEQDKRDRERAREREMEREVEAAGE